MKTRPAIAYTITGRAQTNQIACRFLHPDYTVGPGVSPGQHSLGVVAGCTASGGSHPALKRTFFAEYNAAGLSCQALLCIFLTSLSRFAPPAVIWYTDFIIRQKGICFYAFHHQRSRLFHRRTAAGRLAGLCSPVRLCAGPAVHRLGLQPLDAKKPLPPPAEAQLALCLYAPTAGELCPPGGPHRVVHRHVSGPAQPALGHPRPCSLLLKATG